jgi:hypothetical protein
MLLSQLFEAINKKHAAFCFGRMNPPTVGHGQLIDTVAQAAAGSDYFIFTSQTQDSKKNPLDYATKVKFIKAMFPQQASHVVYDPSLKTIMQVAAWLYNKGYRKVTFVAGSDRLENFKELLEKYNGLETANGFYKFDSINFVSSGDRDPDADGIAGVSASAAREAAKAGNLAAFAQATGAGELSEPLYLAVRRGMLVEGSDNKIKYSKNKSLSEQIIYNDLDPHDKGMEDGYIAIYRNLYPIGTDEHDEYNDGYFQGRLMGGIEKPVAEGASGYIPKNKREARDPRWSNALTVDVKPDTPNKNLKALRLK